MHIADSKIQAVAHQTLSGKTKQTGVRAILPFLGPAFIASVAYVDPGNFATNIQAGAQFGNLLLWVVVASNLMAMLIQALSAKLGIATGKNLAQICRERFDRRISLGMWVIMEVVVMATDLAEFLGAAVGFQLLFHTPLIVGALLAVVTTFLVLGLERYGFRPLEAVITSMVGVIATCYVIETFFVRPDIGNVLFHAVVPQFQGTESILLASGILGATVMPHAIYLHSALTQNRIVVREPDRLRLLFRYELLDVTIAMGLAGLVNMAMLMMAASTFHAHGFQGVGTLEEAHQTLQPLLGSAASWIFALSLLFSGISSCAVGTSAGQIIMQGFIQRHIPIWVRRAITILPSLIIIGLGLDPTRALVISQVVLSFGLPFAVIPLAMFTSNQSIMGVLINKRITTLCIWLVSGLILLLNMYLIWQLIFGGTT